LLVLSRYHADNDRAPAPSGPGALTLPVSQQDGLIPCQISELNERTDGELVAAALTGQSRAFGALVTRYMRPGYLVAFSVTGNPEDAEDVAQEAFLVALERLEDCRDPDRFGGWFLTIVRNRARNLLRRESLRRGEELSPEISPGRGGPAEDYKQLEIRERLEKGLEGLSEIRKEVLLLHDLEGWKHREIGERLGIPDGTVRSHLHFARKHLRVRLGPFYGSPPEGEES
jgi:RNA polymerase sigma-70 factor (ECF subfamily)